MKYRALGNLHSISRGDFVAYVEDGRIELPEDIARDLLQSGEIAPDTEHKEISNDRLHDFGSSETSARKRRKRG